MEDDNGIGNGHDCKWRARPGGEATPASPKCQGVSKSTSEHAHNAPPCHF